MTSSDRWLCNDCARKLAELPPEPSGSLLLTAYQQQKFSKHTVGDPASPTNSVYNSGDESAYEDSARRTMQEGAVQIDDQGRRNVFRPLNRPIGVTHTVRGQFVVSGEKVVLGDEAGRVHAFPYGSPVIPKKRCNQCGSPIPW